MDPLRIVEDVDGFFTTATAREVGHDHTSITRHVRAGVWRRLRRGYYVFADTWASLDDVGRHLVRCRAVCHSLGPGVVLSHASGALVHGIATWDVDLSRVHVTRLDGGAGRVEGDVVHHEGFCLDEEVGEVDGVPVLPAVRCALETGSRATGAARLVPLDSLLHLGLATYDELGAQFRLMERWPWMRRMHVPVRMADAGGQSPGESRGRWLMWTAGLPAPRTQLEVRDAGGELLGTADWGWPEHGLLGEFDGRVSTDGSCARGRTPARSCSPRSSARTGCARPRGGGWCGSPGPTTTGRASR